MKNVDSDKSEEIKLMNALELFVFHNMLHSMSSENRSDSTLIQAKNENEFRLAVYALHDEGKLKETEQQKIARLRTYPYTDDEGYTFIDLPNRQCPKYYDEVVTAIRDFHQLLSVNSNQFQLTQAQKKAFKIYADHSDGCYLSTIPQTIFKEVYAIKNAYETDRLKKLKIAIYLECLNNSISKNQSCENKKKLWNDLKFKDKDIIKYEQSIESRLENKKLYNDQHKLHQIRLDSLINHLHDNFYIEIFEKYKEKINIYIDFYTDEIKLLQVGSQHIKTLRKKLKPSEYTTENLNKIEFNFLNTLDPNVRQKYETSIYAGLHLKQIKEIKTSYIRMRSKKLKILKELKDDFNKIEKSSCKKNFIKEFVGNLNRIIKNNIEIKQKLESLILTKSVS